MNPWACLKSTAITVVAGLAASLPALDPAFAGGGRLGGGEDLNISLGRILTALLICIAIAFLAALAIRQRSGRVDLSALFSRFERRQPLVQVVETRRLSQHADICLVRHDGCDYLLLLMAGDARVLNQRPTAGETEAAS